MLRSAMLTSALWLVGLTSNGHAQTIDTARVRAAYDSVSSLRAGYERVNGRFVTVNGIKMHYLEWGAPNGVPLVWAHGSASNAYELRAVAPRLAQAGYRVEGVMRCRTKKKPSASDCAWQRAASRATTCLTTAPKSWFRFPAGCSSSY